jgi:hypothetical protein
VGVYEVVGEGVRFLAEEVHVVAHLDQRPAEVLNVDVAPRAGEHVAVSHEKPHGSIVQKEPLTSYPSGEGETIRTETHPCLRRSNL